MDIDIAIEEAENHLEVLREMRKKEVGRMLEVCKKQESDKLWVEKIVDEGRKNWDHKFVDIIDEMKSTTELKRNLYKRKRDSADFIKDYLMEWKNVEAVIKLQRFLESLEVEKE